MNSIIILFDNEKLTYKTQKVFDNKSAQEITSKFAENLELPVEILKAGTVSELLEKVSSICHLKKVDNVIFSFDDCIFLNEEITKKLLDYHVKYKSEYTFADGYPYGFCPEVIHSGTIDILLELTKTTQHELGQKKITRNWIFDLLKTDINSFEIETLMAPQDWRLLRLSFDCEKKENFIATKELFNLCQGNLQKNINELSDMAAKCPDILRTVPGFYNIQISNKINTEISYAPYLEFCKNQNYKLDKDFMDYGDFEKLVDKIADFSENAVIGLSLWGEAFLNPDLLKMIEKVLSYKGLSVFIETDGLHVTEDFCERLKLLITAAEERSHSWEKVMIAVRIDAFSSEIYSKLHVGCKNSDFATSVEAVKKLYSAIPGNVYPQFTRLNDNEEELESFFRYWKENSNGSGGQLIIQKYNDFAGQLAECKPADLSPIDRNPCWHLRRDMVILMDGRVPVCKQCVFTNIVGNAFTESLESIWDKNKEMLKEHICKNYNKMCGKCDEFYTYEF